MFGSWSLGVAGFGSNGFYCSVFSVWSFEVWADFGEVFVFGVSGSTARYGIYELVEEIGVGVIC